MSMYEELERLLAEHKRYLALAEEKAALWESRSARMVRARRTGVSEADAALAVMKNPDMGTLWAAVNDCRQWAQTYANAYQVERARLKGMGD